MPTSAGGELQHAPCGHEDHGLGIEIGQGHPPRARRIQSASTMSAWAARPLRQRPRASSGPPFATFIGLLVQKNQPTLGSTRYIAPADCHRTAAVFTSATTTKLLLATGEEPNRAAACSQVAASSMHAAHAVAERRPCKRGGGIAVPVEQDAGADAGIVHAADHSGESGPADRQHRVLADCAQDAHHGAITPKRGGGEIEIAGKHRRASLPLITQADDCRAHGIDHQIGAPQYDWTDPGRGGQGIQLARIGRQNAEGELVRMGGGVGDEGLDAGEHPADLMGSR
jgi:hypothetical protein